MIARRVLLGLAGLLLLVALIVGTSDVMVSRDGLAGPADFSCGTALAWGHEAEAIDVGTISAGGSSTLQARCEAALQPKLVLTLVIAGLGLVAAIGGFVVRVPAAEGIEAGAGESAERSAPQA